MADYDVIVLGGGPGGYIAAERLGHAGSKVLLVEKEALGGTCLNVGCIPTKSLLNSAKLYEHAQHSAQFGVTATGVAYDWATVQAWKADVVGKLVAGVGAAEKRAGVEVVRAHGTLLAPGVVEVEGVRRSADHVILATGSVPVMPPIPGAADNPLVVDSTGLLAVEAVPKRLVVIGGGVIGVEFASLFAAFGSQVDGGRDAAGDRSLHGRRPRAAAAQGAQGRHLPPRLPGDRHRGWHRGVHRREGGPAARSRPIWC